MTPMHGLDSIVMSALCGSVDVLLKVDQVCATLVLSDKEVSRRTCVPCEGQQGTGRLSLCRRQAKLSTFQSMSAL